MAGQWQKDIFCAFSIRQWKVPQKIGSVLSVSLAAFEAEREADLQCDFESVYA